MVGLCGLIIYRPDELCQNLFGFRASLWYLASGKNLIVIRLAVPEIFGEGPPLTHTHTHTRTDVSKLSKRTDAINL